MFFSFFISRFKSLDDRGALATASSELDLSIISMVGALNQPAQIFSQSQRRILRNLKIQL